MKLLFLAHEISGYFLACLRELIEHHDASVLLVRRPVSEGFPICLSRIPGLRSLVFSDSIEPILLEIEQFKPDIVLACGWMHREYLQISKMQRTRVPVICALDNWWLGTGRQRIGAVLARNRMHRCFSHAWVPGTRQYEFARRIGFRHESVLTGLYTADVPHFAAGTSEDPLRFPKVLAFVGRLVPYKNPHILYEIFHSLSDEERNGWNLVLCGNGPLSSVLADTPICRQLGFAQPTQLPEILGSVGACILPSDGENWGVAVHEFAAAGRPILSTEQCAAADSFVLHHGNGFRFDCHDRQAFRSAIIGICQTSAEKRVQMGLLSQALAARNTPQIWAAQIRSLVQ